MARMIRGASACVVDQSGRVLMIAREKEPFRDALAFPGGSIEAGESALAAARRELFEETGYRAVGDPFASIVIEFRNDDADVRVESFAFSRWTAPESRGEIATQWMTFSDALASRLAPGMDRALIAFQRAFESARKKSEG